ncbi:MAG TPA: hypothetical protein VI669_00525 [Vicinamibacteria bacterium]
MSRITRLTFMGIGAVLLGPGGSALALGSGEDDLALVRRAVADATPAARSDAYPAPQRPRAQKAEPKWLRVRIKENGGKSTVSVNVPLALARLLGDDIPLDLACGNKRDRRRSELRLGDLLQSLDSGQDIVQIDGDDGSVRVWID